MDFYSIKPVFSCEIDMNLTRNTCRKKKSISSTFESTKLDEDLCISNSGNIYVLDWENKKSFLLKSKMEYEKRIQFLFLKSY